MIDIQRKTIFEKINKKLIYLCTLADIDASFNLLDVNIFSENIFANLLNALYGYELKNANTQRSIDTIDLIDETNKISIQVTSNKSPSKIRNTISSFKTSALPSQGYSLKFVVIANKEYQKIFNETFFTYPRDIITIKSLLRDILNTTDTKKLQAVEKTVDDELKFETPVNFVVYNEVQTICEIIKYISGKDECNDFDEPEPDPDKKINQRFQSHASRIYELFNDYQKTYKILYETILSQTNKADIIKVTNYLKLESVKVLNICNEDPLQALDKIVEDLTTVFSQQSKSIEQGAVYYFLIKQVVACNVFPN